MRKLGIKIHSKKGLSDEEYIKKISEYGFDSMFSGMRDAKSQVEIAEFCAKYNVEYENLHAPYDHINDIWYDTQDGEAMYQELITCLDHCVMTEVPMMVQHLSASFTPPPITEIGKYRFEKLVEYADKKNIRIAFENIYTLENLAWAMERFEKNPNVGLCWDCGHEYCFTQSDEVMQRWGNRLICTHIHDNECILDKDRHMIPFDGKIDFECVAAHLRDSNYKGSLMLEVIAAGNRLMYEQLTIDEYLERSMNAVKRLAKMVDQED